MKDSSNALMMKKEKLNIQNVDHQLKRNRTKDLGEQVIETFFFVCALVAVLSVVIITVYIFVKGVPAISEIGLRNFTLGQK